MLKQFRSERQDNDSCQGDFAYSSVNNIELTGYTVMLSLERCNNKVSKVSKYNILKLTFL